MLPPATATRQLVRPIDAEGVPRMTVQELADHLSASDDLVIVDVRLAEDYQKSRIPGALGIHYREVAANSSRWPKDATVVLY
jgi:rhodanese-related sulfurtransferase